MTSASVNNSLATTLHHLTWVQPQVFSGLPNEKKMVLITMGSIDRFTIFKEKLSTLKTTQEIFDRVLGSKEYTNLMFTRWDSIVGRKLFCFNEAAAALQFIELLTKSEDFKDSIELIPESEVIDVSGEGNPYKKICDYIGTMLLFFLPSGVPGDGPTIEAVSDEALLIFVKDKALVPYSKIDLDWNVSQNKDVKPDEKEPSKEPAHT